MTHLTSPNAKNALAAQAMNDSLEQPTLVNQAPVIPYQERDIQNQVREVMTNPLHVRNSCLDRDVKQIVARKKAEATHTALRPLNSYVLVGMQNQLDAILREHGYDLAQNAFSPTPERIQQKNGCDFSLNISAIARTKNKDISEVASKISNILASHPLIKNVSIMGPFVNISLNHRDIAPNLYAQILEDGERYGSYNEGKGDLVIVDYSSPNVAKNMTVAHLRSTIIGHSLSKLYGAAGYTPLRINHLGDWGMTFGKLFYQYQRELAEHGEVFTKRLERDPTGVLLEIYRKFDDTEKENPQAKDEAALLTLRLEKGDAELVALWEKFLHWSRKDFDIVYERLNVDFDVTQGESFYENRMDAVLEEGLQKKVLKRDNAGIITFPAQPLYDPKTGKMNEKIMKGMKDEDKDEILLKPSGGTMYITRDLAAMRYRTQELGAKKIIYVIGKEQQKHCQMLFAMAEQLGHIERGQAEHAWFGHLNVDGRKMKSRKGKIALLKDVLDETIEAAASHMLEKNGNKEQENNTLSEIDMQEAATKVGIGALIFNDLRQDRTRDIEFSPDAAKHLESGQSPYVQYTYCRLRSIMEKVSEIQGSMEKIPEELSPLERTIMVQLGLFPQIIQDAVHHNAPHCVATYITDLCLLLNNFYAKNNVVKAEEKTRPFLVALVQSSIQVLKNAAYLLHVSLPERM